MLSEAAKDQLALLYSQQSVYRPAPAIAEQLFQRTVIMLVGATCMGKNTIMEAVCTADDRFRISGRFTSRAPRDSDDPDEYTYYPNTDAGLAPLLQRIADRQVVQYAVNPHANLIYGTSIEDYAAEYNLSDVLAAAVDTFRRLPFRRTLAITVVTEPDAWVRRLDERFPPGDPQRRPRLQEAIESLRWSLAQTGSDHAWIANLDGNQAQAAQEVLRIVLEGPAEGGLPPAQLRSLAEACLQVAQGLLA